MNDKSPVSLTGYFTGQVWCENAYSEPEMGSVLGKSLYYIHRPVGWLNERLFGNNLETMLIQRHKLFDALTLEAIEQNPTLQILEIASGLSSRAQRILKQADDAGLNIRYVEADLPQMVNWKQARLGKLRFSHPEHSVEPINILRESGPLSLNAILDSHFDRNNPILVITEGLVNYFELSTIENFWCSLRSALSTFKHGEYIFEIWPKLPVYQEQLTYHWGVSLIEMFTRQRVPLHYTTDESVAQGLKGCGFSTVDVLNPNEVSQQYGLPKMQGECLFRVTRAIV